MVDFDFVPPGSFDLDNTPIAVKGGSLNYELIDEDSVDQAGGLAGEIIKDGSDHWKGFTEGVANMKIVKDIERIRKAYSILKTGRDEYGSPFPLLFRSFDDYKAPIPVYLLVPVFKFFGPR